MIRATVLDARNKLITEFVLALIKEQPTLGPAQLLIITSQFIQKILGDINPILGTLVEDKVDPETYPDAAHYNDITSALVTDISDITAWHKALVAYSALRIEEHLGKLYQENSLISLLDAELKAAALQTAGLLINEWSTHLPVVPTTFETAATTCYIDTVRQEAMPSTSMTVPAIISELKFEILSPSPDRAHIGFGRKFGAAPGSDDAVHASADYGPTNLLNDSETDYTEYEAVFSEALTNNQRCPVAINHKIELQRGHDGTYSVDFWQPVFSQTSPVAPAGSILTDPTKEYLHLKITATLTDKPLISSVVLKQKAISDNYADITVHGISATSSTVFSKEVAGESMKFSCVPINLDQLVFIVKQRVPYRQRYQLYRYIMGVGTSNNLTNLLSDKEL